MNALGALSGLVITEKGIVCTCVSNADSAYLQGTPRTSQRVILVQVKL